MQHTYDMSIACFFIVLNLLWDLSISNSTYVLFPSGNAVSVVHTTKQSVLSFDRVCFVLLRFSGFKAYVIKSGLNEDLVLFVCLCNGIQAFDWRLGQNESLQTRASSLKQCFSSLLLVLTTETMSKFLFYTLLACNNIDSHSSLNNVIDW